MSTFPGAFVPVAPPADGLRLAFVAARRRRNRKAGAAGAVGLLAAVALLASTGGTGNRTLMQEPVPPASTSGLDVLPGADASAAPSTPTDVTTSDGAVLAAPGSGAGAPLASAPQSNGGGTAAASGSGTRVYAQSAKPVSGPMRRSTGLLYTGTDLVCPARKQQERQGGLCTDVFASQSGTNTMSITAEICNVGTATELLSFDTARELDLSIRKGSQEVWRWSLGRQFAATPHELTVGTQECMVWTTDWAQVDAHGVPVKAGDYSLVADLDADEVAGPDRHPTYSMTVSSQP